MWVVAIVINDDQLMLWECYSTEKDELFVKLSYLCRETLA